MIWSITERQIVYKVWKKRRYVDKKLRSITRITDHNRWTKGKLEKDFIDELFFEEFQYNFITKVFKLAHERLRGLPYLKTFTPEVKTTLDQCVVNGYIQRNSSIKGDRLIVLPKGKKLLSIWYFPKKLIEYAPTSDLLGKIFD